MDVLSQWITFFISIFQTLVQWLSSMQVLGVSLLWFIISCFLLSLLIRALLFKP